jgi:hypothetical protein
MSGGRRTRTQVGREGGGHVGNGHVEEGDMWGRGACGGQAKQIIAAFRDGLREQQQVEHRGSG